MTVVAGVLQLLGIAVTAYGIGVVRSWVNGTAAPSAMAAARWVRERWRDLRFRLQGGKGPRVVSVSAYGHARSHASGSGVVVRTVDPEMRGTRDRLRDLEAVVAGLQERLSTEAAERDRQAQAIAARVETETEQLRESIREQGRAGWRSVFAGLALQAVGTIVAMLA